MAADFPIPLRWLAWGAVAFAVLLIVLWEARRRRSAEDAPPESGEPRGPAAEPLPSAFGPPPPRIMAEVPPPLEEEGPVLPAIPRDSTEWMEGDVREGEDVLATPLRPVPDLLAALRTGDPSACDAAVEELARHGAAAVPALEQALLDEDPDVRIDAGRALAAIRGGPA